MQTFYRHIYSQLVITLRADASLGLLNSGYIEDYFGIDNQLTLYNVLQDTRTVVLVEEDIDATPSTPHDVFVAIIDLSTVPDGVYQLQGRARDTTGNYTILTDFNNPSGNEEFILLEFLISPLGVVVFAPKEAQIIWIDGPDADLQVKDKPDGNVWLRSGAIETNIMLIDSLELSLTMVDKQLDASILVLDSPELEILDVYTI